VCLCFFFFGNLLLLPLSEKDLDVSENPQLEPLTLFQS